MFRELAFVVAVVALGGAAIQTYRGVQDVAAAAGQVGTTQQVLAELGELQGRLIDAETGQRGFALTGDESFLAPFNDARAALPGHFGALRLLLAGNAAQGERLNDLERLSRARDERLGRLVEDRRRNLEGSDAELLRESKTQTDRMRVLIGELNAAETARYASGVERARVTLVRTLTVGIVVLAVSLGLILAAIIGWSREARRRARAQDQLNALNADLEARIAARTQELAETNNALRALLDASPAAIVRADAQGVIRDWNRAAETIFGWRADEVVGRRYAEIGMVPAAEIGAMRQRVLDGQTVRGLPARRHHRDGHVIDVLVSVTAMRAGDPLDGIVLMFEDATERRQIEEQLRQTQKMEAVGQLTGGVAHDFNNLLAVIIGNIDAVQEDTQDPAVRQLLGLAMQAAERGAELVRQLLSFARRQPLQPRPTDVADLVQGIVVLLRGTVGQAVHVDLELDRSAGPALVDPTQVEAALMNLVLNARDAMPDGGRLLIATRRRTLDADYAGANPGVRTGDYVQITVSDTGTGMAPDVLARATEPFFTTKPVGRGTGLGLSMIYGFAQQSGGHLKLYSEVGVGTTARLYLPAVDVAPAPNPGLQPVAPVGDGQTVLAVEDDARVREVVTRQLRELKYNVVEAEDGANALALLRGGAQVDLLFTDVVMPGGMTGPQLAEAARALRPGLKVLFTSGFPDAAGYGGKAEDNLRLLSKPYRKADLARAIAAALTGE